MFELKSAKFSAEFSTFAQLLNRPLGLFYQCFGPETVSKVSLFYEKCHFWNTKER